MTKKTELLCSSVTLWTSNPDNADVAISTLFVERDNVVLLVYAVCYLNPSDFFAETAQGVIPLSACDTINHVKIPLLLVM